MDVLQVISSLENIAIKRALELIVLSLDFPKEILYFYVLKMIV